MSDPETVAGTQSSAPEQDALRDDARDAGAFPAVDAGGAGDDLADGGSTGATALDAADAEDEDSGGPGDDAAAGGTTAPASA